MTPIRNSPGNPSTTQTIPVHSFRCFDNDGFMALSVPNEENYALTKRDFADEETGATEVGDGVVEVYDVGCTVKAGDEGFHGEVDGGFVVADVAACG
jgi:hypothetical protein